MKKNNIVHLKLSAFFGLIFMCSFLVGCELELQDNNRFKNESITNDDPFKDISAYEFVSTIGSELTTNDDGEPVLNRNFGFNYMAISIERTGLIDLYNTMSANGRTFFLLSNNAFTSNNVGGGPRGLEPGVFRTLNNNRNFAIRSDESPEETIDRLLNNSPERIEILKQILLYHIVDEVVTQNDISRTGFWDTFRTLQLNDAGNPLLISLTKNFDQDIRINGRTVSEMNRDQLTPSPRSDFSQTRPVEARQHNIRFNNGVGHNIGNYAANQSFI